jgi:hypothetical protein
MTKELHLQFGFLYAGLLQFQCPWFYNHGTHCRCLTGCPARDIPKMVSFGLSNAEIRNSKVQGTQSLDRFGPQDA